ncbi:MAG: heme exporter protein CcmB [Candidatus Thorarchaeota archaeon]|jgi:heme exporter protein CcmB
MTSGLSAAFAIAKKDIVTQFRKKFEAFSMFLFALIAVLAFSFALVTEGSIPQDVGSAMLWVIIFFTGMFGFAPIFLSESETGTLRGLATAPIPAWSVYLGKVFYGFILMGIVEIFLVPIISILFGFSFLNDLPLIIATLVVGTLDLAAVGSMASALTMPSESKATVFPLVYFPTAISGLMLLVEITRIVVIGVIPVVPVLLIFEILLAHLIAMLTLSASVFHFALSP